MCGKVFVRKQWGRMKDNAAGIAMGIADRCLDPECRYWGSQSMFNLNPVTVFEAPHDDRHIWDFAKEPLT